MNTTIKIDGMSCGHCVTRVARALESINGVSEVHVSLENQCADITFNGEHVTREELVSAIEDTGFTVAE